MNNNMNNFINKDNNLLKEKNKNKISIITKVSLACLVVLGIGIFSIIIYSFLSSRGLDVQSQQGYGWLIILVIGAALVIIPYYSIIFVINLVLDIKGIKRKLLKNVLTICFLLLPLMVCFIFGIKIYIKDKQRTFDLGILSVTFPEDFEKSSYAVDFNGEYISVGFFADIDGDRQCSIKVGVSEYDINNDLVSNFKNNCEKFLFVDKNLTLSDVYDSVLYFENEDINGQNWYYYEDYFPNLHYKMYGLVIDESFYKIEILDNSINNSICADNVNEFLKTVQYKGL